MRPVMVKGLVGALATLLICGGCSSGGSSNQLTWSMWIGSSADQKSWQEVGKAGTEAAGKTVELRGAPFNDYWTKIATQLDTSSSPCIVTMQSLRVNQYSSALLPLESLMSKYGFQTDSFDASALAAMQVNGKQYAIPYDNGPVVLFYNRDAFAAAGIKEPAPGWTAEEFESAARTLKAKGQTAMATTVEDVFLESIVYAYNGGRIMTDSGDLDLDNKTFAKGIEWLAGLVKSGEASKANGPDSTADDNAFISGKVAMLPGGAWLIQDLKSKSNFNLGVTTLPAGSGGGGTFSAGSGFGISKDCKHPAAAFKAIAAMTSQKVLSNLATQGRAYPARAAAQQSWYDTMDIDGLKAAMQAAQTSSVGLPGSRKADQLNQLLAQYGPQMVNGQKSASDVLDDIASPLGE